MDQNTFATSLDSAMSQMKAKNASVTDMQALADSMTNDYKSQQPDINAQVWNQVQGGSFGAQTTQNIEDFKNANNFDYQNSLANGLMPINPNTDYGSLSNTPQKSSIGEEIQAPINTIAKAGVNVIGDAFSVAKGLVTLPFHVGDMVDQIVKDPTILLGPAGQQLENGIMGTIQTGDFSNLWKGISGATTSALNHPLLSLLPYLGLDLGLGGDTLDATGKVIPARGIVPTVTELATHPISSTADMLTNTIVGGATKATGMITGGLDFVKNLFNKDTSPFSQVANKISTPAQLTAAATQNLIKIDRTINDLVTKVGDLNTSLADLQKIADETKTPESSIQLDQAKLELEKVNAQKEALIKMREDVINSPLNSIEALKQMGIGPNTTSEIGPAIGTTLDNFVKIAEENYGKALPKNSFPDLQPVIESLDAFRTSLSGNVDAGQAAALSHWEDVLNAKQTVTELFKGSTTAPTEAEIESALNAEEMTTDRAVAKQMGWKFVDASEVKPVSSSLMKTTVMGQMRDSLVGGNTSYGKVFQDTVAPAMKQFFESSVPQGMGIELSKLDDVVRTLKYEHPSLADSFAKANTPTKIMNLLSDPEVRGALSKVDGKLNDVANQAMMKVIMEKAKNSDGTFNGNKLDTLLEQNKNFINKRDYMAAKEQALNLKANDVKQAEIEAQLKENKVAQKTATKNVSTEQTNIEKVATDAQKTVGTNPTEVFNNISKIGSPEDLADFAQKAGVEPTDVGATFIKAVISKEDPSFAEGTTAKFQGNIENVDKALQKFGGDGPQRAEVRDAAFGKDGAKLVDDLHQLRLQNDAIVSKGGKLS